MRDSYWKVWRSSQEDGLWRSLPGEQFKAMIGILGSVNWKPGEWICPKCKQKIVVPAGGTIKTYRTLAEEAGVKSSTMFKTLTRLGRSRFLVKPQSPSCHTLYVVKNWHLFQGEEAKGKQGVSKEEAKSEHIEEGKQGSREEVPPKPPRGQVLSAASQGLAKWWGDSHPWWQDHDFGARELAAWSKALDQILRMDKRTELEIRHLASLIFGDVRDGGGFPGWARNCRTPGKLRQKKDGATYWEIISDQLSGRNRQSFDKPRNGPMKGAPDTYTGPGKRT